MKDFHTITEENFSSSWVNSTFLRSNLGSLSEGSSWVYRTSISALNLFTWSYFCLISIWWFSLCEASLSCKLLIWNSEELSFSLSSSISFRSFWFSNSREGSTFLRFYWLLALSSSKSSSWIRVCSLKFSSWSLESWAFFNSQWRISCLNRESLSCCW